MSIQLISGITIFVSAVTAFVFLYISGRRYQRERQGLTIYRTERLALVSPFGGSMINGFQHLLNEEVVKRKLIFWVEPCIDVLHWHLDVKATLAELGILAGCTTKKDLEPFVPSEERDKKYILFIDRPLLDLPPALTKTSLAAFWSSQLGGFCQRPDLWVSTDACASALVVIIELTKYDDEPLPRKEALARARESGFGLWLDGCGKLLQSDLLRSGALISDAIGREPSISSNHGGWMCLRDLGRAGQLSSEVGAKAFADALGGFVYNANEQQAFKDSAGDSPSICAAHHALATLSILAPRAQKLVWETLQLQEENLLNFALKCKHPRGGYSACPEGEATAAHTRYALALARSLIAHETPRLTPQDILSRIGLDPIAMLDYLDSLWTPLGFRLALSTSPSIYSTRASLLVLKYLELFRINNIMPADTAYTRKRNSLVERAAGQWDQIVNEHYKTEAGIIGFSKSLT